MGALVWTGTSSTSPEKQAARHDTVAVAPVPVPHGTQLCAWTIGRVRAHRETVWAMQQELGRRRTPISATQKIRSCRYARWVEGLWWRRQVALRHDVQARRDVARRLDRFLARYPMRRLGTILERVGRREGVSPFFIVAVAGKESSFGLAACTANPRNVWGLGACGRAWTPPYFNTWEEAITFFARFVEGRTSVYHGWPNAQTPWDFHGYCAGCETSWAAGVSRFMTMMGAQGVAYP